MTGRADPIGLLGLGRMGLAMAQRLIERGFRVVAFDPAPGRLALAEAAGVTPVGSPADVGGCVTVVCASLPTPEAAEDAFFGAGGAAQGRTVRMIVDFSTIGPAAAFGIAERLAHASVAYVEAPVSGGPDMARVGQLSVMLAGAADAIASVKPVLDALSVRHLLVGERPGTAQGMKLVNNLVGLSQLALVGEALVLAAVLGVDGATATSVLNSGVARSHVSEAWIPKHVLTRTFDYGFSTALAAKDLRLALAQLAAHGFRLPVAEASGAAWEGILAAEGADADITACLRPLERAAGIVVEGARHG